MRAIGAGLYFAAWVSASALAGCGSSDGNSECDPDAPDTICTIAGTGEDTSGSDGPAKQSPIYHPVDMAVSPGGELWVLDFNNYVVRAIDAAGSIRTVVGTGQIGESPLPGVPQVPALAASLNHLANLAFRGDYLYLAAWHNSSIKRVRLSDMMLENVAGRGERSYYDGDGGPALEAGLDAPSAIAFDRDGNLAIMDQQNQVIRQVDAAGVIRTIAGRCVTDLVEACAPGEVLTACPDSGKYTCGDPAADTCNQFCNPGFDGDGGRALDARLGQPFGAVADPSGRMAYDSAGNLLFADTDNHRIRKIDTAGIITTIAGTGAAGYAGDGGPAIAAQLDRPVDIAIGADDTIYFTDIQNNCIRKIDPSGVIARVAGQCGGDKANRGSSGDGGSPLDAMLDRPYGIELAGTKLYVADTYNHRIRVINLPR